MVRIKYSTNVLVKLTGFITYPYRDLNSLFVRDNYKINVLGKYSRVSVYLAPFENPRARTCALR